MPNRPCPNCPGIALRHVPGASDAGALVNYYRCDACGHVFTVAKATPNAPAESITTTPSDD